jgi:hypothetical protein
VGGALSTCMHVRDRDVRCCEFLHHQNQREAESGIFAPASRKAGPAVANLPLRFTSERQELILLNNRLGCIGYTLHCYLHNSSRGNMHEE